MSYSILSYFYTNKPQCLKGGGQIVKIDQFGHTGDDFFLLWALRTRLKQLNVEFCRIHEYWILAFQKPQVSLLKKRIYWEQYRY